MTEASQNLRQIEIPKTAKTPLRKVKLLQKGCVWVARAGVQQHCEVTLEWGKKKPCFVLTQ